MVRTKDLFLIVAVLVMLCMAISATLASRMLTKQMQEDALSSAVNSEPPAYEATTSVSPALDRSSHIERLRSLLAAGDVIESSPSVESSPQPETPSDTASASMCSAPGTGIEIARNWPLVGVSVSTVGASRVVTHTPIEAAAPPAAGTTSVVSAAAPTPRTLLELQLYPVKQGEPICMSSEIIGVTPTGSLLFNNDVVLYRQTGSEALIGYALDGFPIYGSYAGATDACGGYDAPGGYRYVVSAESQSFIQCFVGIPSSFNL